MLQKLQDTQDFWEDLESTLSAYQADTVGDLPDEKFIVGLFDEQLLARRSAAEFEFRRQHEDPISPVNRERSEGENEESEIPTSATEPRRSPTRPTAIELARPAQKTAISSLPRKCQRNRPGKTWNTEGNEANEGSCRSSLPSCPSVRFPNKPGRIRFAALGNLGEISG